MWSVCYCVWSAVSWLMSTREWPVTFCLCPDGWFAICGGAESDVRELEVGSWVVLLAAAVCLLFLNLDSVTYRSTLCAMYTWHEIMLKAEFLVILLSWVMMISKSNASLYFLGQTLALGPRLEARAILHFF